MALSLACTKRNGRTRRTLKPWIAVLYVILLAFSPWAIPACFPLQFGERLQRFKREERITRVITYIESNLSKRLSLCDLAVVAHLSISRLCHVFRLEIGVPPVRYVRAQRLAQASRLLRSSSLSIEEIAFACGFSDVSHFVRDFKRAYGARPSQYRHCEAA